MSIKKEGMLVYILFIFFLSGVLSDLYIDYKSQFLMTQKTEMDIILYPIVLL